MVKRLPLFRIDFNPRSYMRSDKTLADMAKKFSISIHAPT